MTGSAAAVPLVDVRDRAYHVLGTPVLANSRCCSSRRSASALLLLRSRALGDPRHLFQHLFLVLLAPSVLRMVLPSMGVVSELVAASAQERLRLSSSRSRRASPSSASRSWVTTLFVAGLRWYAAHHFWARASWSRFRRFKVFNWTADAVPRRDFVDTPMLYAIGFIGLSNSVA